MVQILTGRFYLNEFSLEQNSIYQTLSHPILNEWSIFITVLEQPDPACIGLLMAALLVLGFCVLVALPHCGGKILFTFPFTVFKSLYTVLYFNLYNQITWSKSEMMNWRQKQRGLLFISLLFLVLLPVCWSEVISFNCLWKDWPHQIVCNCSFR